MERKLKFKQEQKQENSRLAALKKLAFNKWSLTFAVMLIMLSTYLAVGQPEQQNDVLYVTDTLPYDVQKVSGDGNVQILPEDENTDKQTADNSADNGDNADNTDNADNADNAAQTSGEPDLNMNLQEGLDEALDEAGQFSINSDSDFFINYRLEREKARSRQLELLQGLIDDASTSAEIRAESQQRIIAQAEAIEQELMLESILVAKYGGEAAVFIQPEKANVVLSLNQDKMSDSEAEKIAALVDNYTGIGYENIIVVLKD